jgi:ERCC4-type nuclease
MKILIDTREQQPLNFTNHETQSSYLKTGDYTIENYEDKIAFERKSPQDLFQTLSWGHDRFRDELQRASSYDYFAIVVEVPFTSVLNKSFRNAHYSSLKGTTITKMLSTIRLKYGVDIIYCTDRREASQIIEYTFESYLKLQNKKHGGPIK